MLTLQRVITRLQGVDLITKMKIGSQRPVAAFGEVFTTPAPDVKWTTPIASGRVSAFFKTSGGIVYFVEFWIMREDLVKTMFDRATFRGVVWGVTFDRWAHPEARGDARLMKAAVYTPPTQQTQTNGLEVLATVVDIIKTWLRDHVSDVIVAVPHDARLLALYRRMFAHIPQSNGYTYRLFSLPDSSTYKSALVFGPKRYVDQFAPSVTMPTLRRFITRLQGAVRSIAETAENDAGVGMSDQAMPLILAAIDQFGITRNPREAGFIIPTGHLLDFSGKREGGERNMRSYDHSDIGQVVPDEIQGTEKSGMLVFMRHTGAIRMGLLSGGELFLDIPLSVSNGQLRRLIELIEYATEVTIDVTDPTTEKTTASISFDIRRASDRGAVMRYLRALPRFSPRISPGTR